MYESRLIVLRGNSGSGKSTTAGLLREKMGGHVALVGQDHFRRVVLKEKEIVKGHNVDLIKMVTEFALAQGYDVILEGIFTAHKYKDMICDLVEKCPRSLVYYMDIPFEETVRRYYTKSNAGEFGPDEMREWYNDKNVLGVGGERVISVDLSQEEIIDYILNDLASI